MNEEVKQILLDGIDQGFDDVIIIGSNSKIISYAAVVTSVDKKHTDRMLLGMIEQAKSSMLTPTNKN